jgi:hypothetical protein
MQVVIVQDLDVRGVRTQALFGDNHLKVEVVLTRLDDQAFGGIALTVV